MGRFSAYVIVFLFLLIVYTLFFKDFMYQSFINKPADIPDFIFYDITISHFNDGVLAMEVSTNRAVIYQGDSDVLLDQTNGVSFFENSFLRFNADTSQMNLKTGAIQLSNAYLVYAQGDDFYWFDSKEIMWSADKNIVFSDSITQILNSKFRIMADSLKWDMLTQELLFQDYPKIYLDSSYEK